MRFLQNISVALFTALVCNFGWCLPGPSAYQAAEVTYSENTGSMDPVFKRAGGGLREAESELGWYFPGAWFLPDQDGDGVADVALAIRRWSGCGNDVEGALEVVSGADLTPIGTYRGRVDFRLQLSEDGDLLMTQVPGFGYPAMLMLDRLPSQVRWRQRLGDAPAFVGDTNGDGFSDVAIGRQWTHRTIGGQEVWVGSVELLSGKDGKKLWESYGRDPRAGFGCDVTFAGDIDGDGIPDVVGLAHDSLAILSGVDGVPLRELGFPSGEEMWSVRAAGDLDGDGLDELLLHEESSREHVHPIVYSSLTWKPIDVSDGWRITWAAENGDLDGDGLDDLVIGRTRAGEHRISVYSQAGLRDIRQVHVRKSGWDEVWKARVGRFRDDGPWYVLLVILPERPYFDESGTVVLIPGE